MVSFLVIDIDREIGPVRHVFARPFAFLAARPVLPPCARRAQTAGNPVLRALARMGGRGSLAPSGACGRVSFVSLSAGPSFPSRRALERRGWPGSSFLAASAPVAGSLSLARLRAHGRKSFPHTHSRPPPLCSGGRENVCLQPSGFSHAPERGRRRFSLFFIFRCVVCVVNIHAISKISFCKKSLYS